MFTSRSVTVDRPPEDTDAALKVLVQGEPALHSAELNVMLAFAVTGPTLEAVAPSAYVCEPSTEAVLA